MSIEFDKPRGCVAVGLFYALPNRDPNLVLLCGDRRGDFPADMWSDEEAAKLASDAIKGLCIKCPNKNQYEASR